MTTPSTSPRGRKAPTNERIIDAAERLFGTYGIDGVSLRQITAEAGASNNSAITYHFGDRENLVREIWRSRLPQQESARALLLDQTLEQGLDKDPHALARVLHLPAYYMVAPDGRHRYAAFLRQALRSERGRAMRQEFDKLSPSSTAANSLYRPLFPGLTDELFRWRQIAAGGLFLDLVCDRDQDIADGLPVMPEATFLQQSITLLVACCAA